MHACIKYSKGNIRVGQCEHYSTCHQLRYCLCEVALLDWEADPSLGIPSPDDPTRRNDGKARLVRTSWPTRRKQILSLYERFEVITSRVVSSELGASPGMAVKWLRRLGKEAAIVAREAEKIPGKACTPWVLNMGG